MNDVGQSVKKLRAIGGFCRDSRYGLIEIYGKDAQRFLQAQTTNDVAALGECSRQESCLLDRKAHIQAHFELYRKHESYRIICDRLQVDAILSHLDRYRVADKVEFLDLTETGEFFVLQGPRVKRVLNVGMHGRHRNPALFKGDVVDIELWGTSAHLFRMTITGEDGHFIWIPSRDCEQFEKSFFAACEEQDLVRLTPEVIETARVESGLVKFRVDFNNENFLPESGLDQHAVSYTKGCFLGQEVLARVRSQGAPTRGLVGVLFPPDVQQVFKHDTHVMHNNVEIAMLKSVTYSPMLERVIAIASAKREYRTPDKTWHVTVDGKPLAIEVVLLPCYHSESLQSRARKLYDAAIKDYATESDAVVPQVVQLLREALELDPVLEDAYEALGVVLSKTGRLDEAIDLMKQLVNLNAESVMAHTNLSVFYVDKGMIEQAEEEKAISMSIRMRMAAKQVSAGKEEEQAREQERQDARERMELFQQVIAIDPEDLLANYGLGSCYVTLGEYEKGVPLLQKAIAVKPSYTQAYASLGEAFEAMGKVQDAIKTYETGIEVAAKRGDITPLNAMKQKLFVLKEAKEQAPAS